MKKIIDFISRTSSGMAVGLFATLILGTIIKQLCSFGEGWEFGLKLASIVTSLMGAGIGLGVALSMRKDLTPLELGSCVALGAIAGCINLVDANKPILEIKAIGASGNPLLIYIVILLTIFIVKKILIKKTPVDILLVPLTYIIIGTLLSCAFIYPCYYIIYGISKLVEISMPIIPEIMSIIIGVIIGMCLTLPISSVAICVAIQIDSTPLAAGAAVIGCTVQMIGFAVQAARSKNNIGKVISIGIGTSMLVWPNIIKKPIIWLPTILSSVILCPIGVCLLGTTCTSAGAGMGSCGLVGQLASLGEMGYGNWQVYVSIFVIQILGTIILTYLFDFLFKDVFKLYSNEDLKLNF